MKIRCKVINSLCNYKFKIYIYKKNKLIYSGFTNENGYMEFNAKKGCYKLVIYSKCLYPNLLCTSFINDEDICLNFELLSNIKLILTDKNYSDLRIEKGVINLWQDHIV